MTSRSHFGSVEFDILVQEWEKRCCRGFHHPFFAVYGATGLIRDPKKSAKNIWRHLINFLVGLYYEYATKN